MEKLLFIYNPNSGKKNIGMYLDRFSKIFSAEGKMLTLYRIGDEKAPPLEEVITECNYDGIVVSGGDGSVNSVTKLMLDHGVSVPLGVIPNGTCNDFARSLGLPTDPIRCARLIAQGNVIDIDIGIINGGEEIFVNELAGGILASVSFSTDQNAKKMFGPLAYYVTGIGELANMKPFSLTVEADGKTYQEDALVFLVLNGKDISGFSNVAKDAEMQDGKMNLLIFKNSNPLDITDTLFRFVTGGNFREETVLSVSASKCRISSDTDVSVTVDGERGPRFPLELEMKKKALKIYC